MGTEDSTEVTKVYSGKAARGIRTEFMSAMNEYSGTIPDFPIQNAMTQDIRKAAAKTHNSEYMSLWAGQGLRMAEEKTAADIIIHTIDEAERIAKHICS
jgi:nitronate monooxygenase